MAVDPKWHGDQVARYAAERETFAAYAQDLRSVLERLCQRLCPTAIVQARPKSVMSFAEKAARKAGKYRDPVSQLTDLCAARVIVHSQGEVDCISEWIRTNLVVDDANSLDTAERLGESEFGYLSVHFVVQLPETASEAIDILGVPVRAATIGRRKAEIQVRTILQHAWGDILHDRLYKTVADVPRPLKREAHALAALLEEGDGIFGRLIEDLEAYRADIRAHMTPSEVRDEIGVLNLALGPRNGAAPSDAATATALRIARLWSTLHEWDSLVEALTPYAGVQGELRPHVLSELGYALCRGDRVACGPAYERGQRLLEEAALPGEPAHVSEVTPDTRARVRGEAMARLAWTYTGEPRHAMRARELYWMACQCDPTSPYHFASYVEHDLHISRDRGHLPGLYPGLRAMAHRCQRHAAAGLMLPQAHFTAGMLCLLMDEAVRGARAGGDPDGLTHEQGHALAHYAKGIELCLADTVHVAGDCLPAVLASLGRARAAVQSPNAYDWAERLIQIARHLRGGNDSHVPPLPSPLYGGPFTKPVLIVAGGTDASIQAQMAQYERDLLTALSGQGLAIISGGTTAGICGAVGTAVRKLRGRGEAIDLVGYLPNLLQVGTAPHPSYSPVVQTEGDRFSPLEPLQNWIDLISGGVHPTDVKLLGINGGRIAGFEYRLALALGAEVAVVGSSGRAASALLRDPDWRDHPRLLDLPRDPMAIRAFLGAGAQVLTPVQVEAAARAVHDDFRARNRGRRRDESMLEWDLLSDDLQDSSRSQVRHYGDLLRATGFHVAPMAKATPAPVFTKGQVETMAEMEHGRWVVDRLRHGYRYGSERDLEARRSPFLVGWSELPDSVREWDRQAVRGIPGVLAKAELAVVR